jgi:hypothetical protein
MKVTIKKDSESAKEFQSLRQDKKDFKELVESGDGSFTEGYKKTEETLYTEDQVREAIKYALNEAKEAVLWIDTYHNIVSDKFIQSLKQPKQ